MVPGILTQQKRTTKNSQGLKLPCAKLLLNTNGEHENGGENIIATDF